MSSENELYGYVSCQLKWEAVIEQCSINQCCKPTPKTKDFNNESGYISFFIKVNVQSLNSKVFKHKSFNRI